MAEGLKGIKVNGVVIGADDDGNLTIGGTKLSMDSADSNFDSKSLSILDNKNNVQEALIQLAHAIMDKKNWKYVTTDSDYTAEIGDYIRCKAGLTVTAPDSPQDGDRIAMMDLNGKGADEDFIFDGNGKKIYGEDTVKLNIKWFAENMQFSSDADEWRLESTPVTDN